MKADPTRTKTLVRSAERAFTAPIERFYLRMKPIIIDMIRRNQERLTKNNDVAWIQLSVVSEIENVLDYHDEATLRKELRRTSRKYINKFYQKSSDKAAVDIRNVNVDYHFDLTRGDIEAINVLADNGFSLLKNSTSTMRASYLQTISNGMLRGHGIPKMVKAMRAATNKSKMEATRIARTETLNAYNQGAINQYKKAGITHWRWLTAIDDRTCPECEPLDNLVFDMNAPRPPKHPNCRCAVAPVVEDKKTGKIPEKAPAAPPKTLKSCKTLSDMERYATNKFPNTKWDFKGAHVDTIRPTIKQWEILARKYPEVAKQIKYVGTYRGLPTGFYSENYSKSRFDQTAYAHSVYDWTKKVGQIGLNPTYYGHPRKLSEAMWRGNVVKWNPEGCNSLESLLTHEFGHQYYYNLRFNPDLSFNKLVAVDGLGNYGGTLTLFEHYHHGTEALSGYAMKNNTEAWAEGFRAMHHGTAKVRSLPFVKYQRRLVNLTTENRYTKTEWSWSADLDHNSDAWIDYVDWRDNMNKYLGFGGK